MKSTTSLAEMRTWQSGLLQAGVYRLTKRYADEFLQAYNLTSMHWLIIGAVFDSGDVGLSVSDLARQAGTTTSYMTTTLNKLEKLNAVCRKIETSANADNRQRILIVPDSYRPTCLQIEDGLREVFRTHIYNRISRQELETYITVLQKLGVDDSPNG